jgi:hypothetical protein
MLTRFVRRPDVQLKRTSTGQMFTAYDRNRLSNTAWFSLAYFKIRFVRWPLLALLVLLVSTVGLFLLLGGQSGVGRPVNFSLPGRLGVDMTGWTAGHRPGAPSGNQASISRIDGLGHRVYSGNARNLNFNSVFWAGLPLVQIF